MKEGPSKPAPFDASDVENEAENDQGGGCDLTDGKPFVKSLLVRKLDIVITVPDVPDRST